MFTKHISDLEYLDIDDLVNIRKEREGYHLDYKEKISDPDRSKKELSKDVSSFGNTGGGFLIIGVNKNYEIVGVDPIIQSKPIDEWLNQVLSTNIDPPVFYYTPRKIEIPGKEKVIVVIHVPESSKKPHMVGETHQYYTRINDSSKPSTHNQVREMFEFSRFRTEEYKEFLVKRKLFDESDPEFGVTRLTELLHSDIPERLNINKPIVIFSLIPKYPKEERIRMPFRDIKEWLDKNNRGYNPIPNFSIFSTGDYSLTLDGMVFNRRYGEELESYLEILDNGYIEFGLSYPISGYYEIDKIYHPCLNWTLTVGIDLFLLGFSRKFYDLISYYEDIELQISFINVLNYKLLGWNKRKFDDWRFRHDRTINFYHNSFKINHSYNPKSLTDDQIIEIGKLHSLKLGRGFGIDQDLCMDEQGNLDTNGLSLL